MRKSSVKILSRFIIIASTIFFFILLHFYGRRLAIIRNSYQYFPQNARNFINYGVREIIKLSDFIYPLDKGRKTDIEIFNLKISAKNWQELNKNLPTAWSQTERLSSEYKQYLPASLAVNNNEYKVEIRVRGWTPIHWSEAKKSLQIKFLKPKYFGKTRMIKLILPEDRQFFIESLSNHLAKKLNIAYLEDDFVWLKINNQDFGIYYLVEDVNSDSLEKNSLATEALVYAEDEPFEGKDINLFNDLNNWRVQQFGQKLKTDDFTPLQKLLDCLKEPEESTKLIGLIDLDYFLRWQAHSVLLGSTHQDFTHNIRLLWDSSMGKFKLIPWDNLITLEPEQIDTSYNPLVDKILQNPNLKQQRNQILLNYLKDKQNIEDDLNYFDNLYQKYRYWFYKDRQKTYPNFQFDREIKTLKNKMEKRYQNLTGHLKTNDFLNDE